MKLKIGELAARSGVTVRALHHYDSIGLLRPSARSDAGYRLYNRDDIAPPAPGAGAAPLSACRWPTSEPSWPSPGAPAYPTIVEQQIAALTRQIDQAGTPCARQLKTHCTAQLTDGRRGARPGQRGSLLWS